MNNSDNASKRNSSRSNGRIASQDPKKGEARESITQDSPDSSPRHGGQHRPIPYIVLIVGLSFLLLLLKPQFIQVFTKPGAPRWMPTATILIGLTITWLFARALLAAQIRAMSLGQRFRADKTVDNLITVVLARTGIFSLWAVLLGLLSLASTSVPDEPTIVNALGTYAVLGFFVGLTLCAVECYRTYASSVQLIYENRTAGARYWVWERAAHILGGIVVFLPLVHLLHYSHNPSWSDRMGALAAAYLLNFRWGIRRARHRGDGGD